MDKLAQYLQQHIYGEVLYGAQAKKHFSHDSSVLEFQPQVIVFPKSEQDVRKVLRFISQLAVKSKRIGVTARGAGSSYTGASIGPEIVMVMSAHLKRISEIDLKKNLVITEPGVSFGLLQQTLKTHGRWMPSQPITAEYSTIGGAVANNVSGIHSVKYGKTSEYVKSIRLVLSNGDIAEVRKLSKREYQSKLGQSGFEGDIYRAVDRLLEDNVVTIAGLPELLPRATEGMNLAELRQKDGTIDLTPLVVGSQGTLGVITQVSLETEPFNPEVAVALIAYSSRDAAIASIDKALSCNKQLPSSYEFFDKTTLDYVRQVSPAVLQKYIGGIEPAMLVVIQNDNPSEKSRASWLKKLTKEQEKLGASVVASANNYDESHKLLGILDITSIIIGQHDNSGRVSLPLIESAVVAPSQLPVLIAKLEQALTDKSICIWGSLSDGVVRVWPRLDLGSLSDRQLALKLRLEYARLVDGLGGSIASTNNIGRWYAAAYKQTQSAAVYEIEKQIKDIFDPQHILNPGVRYEDGSNIDDLAQHLRSDLYDQKAFASHLPR